MRQEVYQELVLIYTHWIETLLGHFVVQVMAYWKGEFSLPEVLRMGQYAIPRKWLCMIPCTRGKQALPSSPRDHFCQLRIDQHVHWWPEGTFKLKDSKFAAELASIVCKSGPFLDWKECCPSSTWKYTYLQVANGYVNWSWVGKGNLEETKALLAYYVWRLLTLAVPWTC